LGEEALAVHRKSKLTDAEKVERSEGQHEGHAHHFLLSWQAKQSIPYTTVTFCENCMKICEDYAPNFGDRRTACCITTTRRIRSYFSLFPRLKGRHFDTTEVMEAESQVVLNTLTEHFFQDAFKKWQKRWERCIRAEGDNFEGDGGQ
jgi:hypothetical protein